MALGLAIPFVPRTGAPPPTTSDFWAGVALVAMFTVPAICTAWHLMHARIVADARGLTFRGFFKSRFVAWSAIEDYELRVPTSQQSKSGTPRSYLKSGGKWRPLLSSFSSFTNKPPLLDLIERRAINAKAKSWQVGDLRDDGEWPKSFEYRDTSGWKLVGKYFLFAFALSSQIWIDFLFKGIAPFLISLAQTWSFLSFWGRVGLVATPFLLCGTMPLTVLAQFPAIRTRRHYLGQKIIATREEISLFREHRKISLKWEEIESYHLETLPGHFQPDKCVIQAGNARIEFMTGISDTKELLTLVKNRATRATTSKWLHQHGASEDVLGGAASLYRDGKVGVGPRIHHYRTRTARAMLPLGIVMSAMCLLPLITGHRNGAPNSTADVGMSVFFLVFAAIPTLYGGLGVGFSRLQCEADGLRQHSFVGERFLRWDEIESLVFNGHYYRVTGRDQKIRFGFVADYQGLVAEIETRAGLECKRDGNGI